MGARHRDEVVLDVGEGLVGRHPLATDALLDPPGGGLDEVGLPEAEEPPQRVPIPEVVAGAHPFGDRVRLLGHPGQLLADVADQPEDPVVGELLAEVGQQGLRRQLEEHRVVPLEGGEHVGVALQRTDAVDAQVALAPTTLPADLEGVGRVVGGEGLHAGCQRLDGSPVLVRALHVGAADVLDGEGGGVGLGQRGHQATPVDGVIDQAGLPFARRTELAAVEGVAGGDGGADLGGADGAGPDRDTPRHQGAEHGEEALVGAGDRRFVAAVLGDRGEAAEQVVARDPDLVEPDAPVVHAVEAELVAAVAEPDAGHRPAALVADRHHDRVDAVLFVADPQLREHGGHPGVGGGVADPLLAGALVRGVDHDRVAVRVVGRGGPEAHHVRAVAELGHGEATEQLALRRRREPALLLLVGAEEEDAPAEEPELDPELHQHREVAEAEGLEGGHELFEGVVLPNHAGVGQGAEPFGGQSADDREDRLPSRFLRLVALDADGGVGQERAHPGADLLAARLEESAHGFRVEGALRIGDRGRLGGAAEDRAAGLCAVDVQGGEDRPDGVFDVGIILGQRRPQLGQVLPPGVTEVAGRSSHRPEHVAERTRRGGIGRVEQAVQGRPGGGVQPGHLLQLAPDRAELFVGELTVGPGHVDHGEERPDVRPVQRFRVQRVRVRRGVAMGGGLLGHDERLP